MSLCQQPPTAEKEVLHHLIVGAQKERDFIYGGLRPEDFSHPYIRMLYASSWLLNRLGWGDELQKALKRDIKDRTEAPLTEDLLNLLEEVAATPKGLSQGVQGCIDTVRQASVTRGLPRTMTAARARAAVRRLGAEASLRCLEAAIVEKEIALADPQD